MTDTYEGRPLRRPDAHIEDQGLGFDLETVLGRRHLLRAFGLGAVTVAGLAACSDTSDSSDILDSSDSSGSSSTPSSSSAEIPDETAGPYPGDGSNGPNVLTQSGIVRSDITSSFGGSTGMAEGVPMTLELSIVDLAGGGGPFAGVAVYVWHCDRAGRYSLYSQAVTDQNYLRGVQVADASGKVRFTSIFPACYDGRWPHIHFEVYRNQDAISSASNAIATSQVALPKETCQTVYAQSGYEASVTNLARVSLQNDNVFGDDGAAHQLGTATGSVSSGYAVSLTVPVDTRTTPARGGAPGSR
ncbi:intradiol ring-cleavage dioxygenase [Dactylosporangium darangshiense]|uniref:Intradiol ring-cleavage dioxygenase n=1 Tax=Dactylosporangium darangshiense TaxID=579108 RepID=A0ABP8DSE6_9ACTN